MDYLSIKALHIVFVITWFAGLFYIPRIFIYQTEALSKPEPEKSILQAQLAIMAKRLWYIITWPSAMITALMAGILLYLQPQWIFMPFMQIKLILVGLLYGYHFSLHFIFKLLQLGMVKYSSMQLRIWNEVSTIILISIVFLIVKKDQLTWISALLGIFALIVLLFCGIKLYKYIRTKS